MERAKSSLAPGDVRLQTRRAAASSFVAGIVLGVYKLVESFAAVPAAKDFHVEYGIEEHIPGVAFRIPDVDGEALGTTHVLAGGVLFHVRVRTSLASAGARGNDAGTMLGRGESVVGLKLYPTKISPNGGTCVP